MKAALLLLALAVAALVGATHASARVSCAPGGTTTRTYCGPAKATLVFGGNTYHFRKGGHCGTDSSNFQMDTGTFTVYGKPQSAYLGVTSFGKKPGTHDAAVTWQLHGKTHTLGHARVTLFKGLTGGTFHGLMNKGHTAHGSFTCH